MSDTVDDTLNDFSVESQIGPFRVEEHINRGGMSHVVRASLQGHLEYALKISRVGRSPNEVKHNNVAIRSEANLLKRLHHQRIVRIKPIPAQDLREHTSVYVARANNLAGQPWYFAMEYLAGGSLRDHLDQFGQLTVREATNIAGNIGLALYHLHSQGRAHNDVKVENIVFRSLIRRGEPFDPVLIDYGTATAAKRYREEAGTMYVMSPERLRDAQGLQAPESRPLIDPTKSDVWSLGIVLYQMLTDNVPFKRTSTRTLTTQIFNHTPHSIRQFNRDVSADLDRFVIAECLAKNPNSRPDMLTVLKFLRRYGKGPVYAVTSAS